MSARTEPSRLASLDQFRGYTVLGMFFVNFMGRFEALPAVFKHHNTYCSYADTIMPHFFFAVGFAYRLTLLRRLESGPAWPAYAKVLRRNLGLILLGIVFYHLDGGVQTWRQLQELGWVGFFQTAFKRSMFQTLTHIGVTAIWVLPVIAAGPGLRIAWIILSGGLHVLLSYGLNFPPLNVAWSNYEWVHTPPVGIDGGPLGFLTWTIPLLVGSLAYDAMGAGKGPLFPASPRLRVPASLLTWGLLLMALGYGLSCLQVGTSTGAASGVGASVRWGEPPFVHVVEKPPPNLFTMSQRAGGVSYLTFGAGLSLVVFALFVVVCDGGGWQVGLLRTLGANALAAYLIHDLVDEAIKPFAPKDAPLWYGLALFALFLGICYLFTRHLERNRLYLRL